MSNLNSPVNQETTKTTSETNASFLRAARAGNLDKVLDYLKENIDINVSNSNGLNALHLASKEGHVHVVEELLRKKADVNAATKKGNTALHIASLAGQQAVVELLVKNGANVDCRSQNGFTPLYMAAQENHLEVVRFLLTNNANQSLATEDGFTPLAVALQQGHEKVVALLLENDSRGKIRLPALHIAAKKNDVKAAALLLSNDPNMDLSPEARMVNCTTKSGFTPLHIAAHYGNAEIAKYLISKGANVNYEARQNITPLHVATKWGKANSVNLLLESGAKIDAKTRDGLTPLHCAARSGHEEVVELLITKQAPINAKTKNGLTSLHMAAQGDHVEAARILLYHSSKLVDQTTCDFLTALHVAAHCGHVKIAKLLIDHKADVNSRALNGFTPLHIACKKNRLKVIELLIKHGASKEATTESGLTPLHVASFMGCMNVVVFLIQHGSLPNVPTIRGETPLHLAARANQTDIVRILLRHGASVDAKAKEQQTPLHIATRLGNTDIIALLLRHGAYVDAPTSDGYTPLHIASKEGQEEVASILFENGASLNVTTKKGFTPLHIAAKYGNIKVASLLLQREAHPDIQGKNGLTPLHVATHYNRPSLAHLLLQHNASPHIVAKNGYSALHIAAKKNQLDIATTLLEYNAKTNCESNAGFTPLHLACQEGHLDMASLLLDHEAEPGAASKNGLTPLHLCAQEDKVNCAAMLVKMNASIDPQTKAGYTPLHVACHFGQINMVKFLLGHMADVNVITKHGFTALHCAAQQGHVLIVKLLLEHGASPDITNNNGQTPLAIAQRLGYISVIEELRQVTQTTLVSTTIKTTEEKYKVQTPETMQETFMSDSEDEMGDEAMFGDAEHYKYLTNEADLNNAADDSMVLTPKTNKRDDSNATNPQTPTLNAELALAGNQDENHINEHELRPESPKTQQTKSQPEAKLIAKSLGNMSMAESIDGSFYNGYASSKNVNLLNETDNIPIESKPKSTGLHLNSFTNLTSSYQKSIDFSVFSSHADNLNTSGAHFNSHIKDFLISFMVDARGGAMKGCRHSGVRVIIPPKRASMPTRITCRFVRKEKLSIAPPLNESESLAARVLEMGPQGCKFLGPVVLEIPHYGSLRGREREIIILRSDAGEKWYEHPISASESAVEEALGCTLELLSVQHHESDATSQQNHEDSLSQVSTSSRIRITRIITHDFPKYFALVSRVKHETHAVSEIGGVISSTIVPKAQAVFPEKALQKKIKLSLQAMPIAHELVSKMFGNRVVVSPIVTIEPRRRKFHKAITLTIPLPKSPFKGMINNYSHNNDSYSLRLLCSITGGLAPAQWEDITGHTPLSYIDECVSFTTTVSARFWLMDCQNVAEATKMATELYREAIAVPFMARFVVYAKRHEYNEAKLRVYCITDDKEEKTLEQREGFTIVAKSKEVEVLDNRVQWLEMSGNIAPISLNKSNVNCAMSAASEQLNMTFMSFYENRLPFTIRVKDVDQNAINGRLVFLKDSRNTLSKLDSATRSAPVCTLDIQLPSYNREKIQHDETKKRATFERGQINLRTILNDSSATLLSQASSSRANNMVEFNLRLLANDLSNLVDNFDWIQLAKLLELNDQDVDLLKHSSSNSPNLLSASLANQTHDMLVYFVNKYNKDEHDEQALSYGQMLTNALHQMGVEQDIIERNSYFISGLLPQSTENIFSVEKSLNNKLNEDQVQLSNQLESSISQLKNAVDLITNHEDRDIMKESESAQISENENEHDRVDNLKTNDQNELSSLINQIDKQMDELGRDNENDDAMVNTVIVGEHHFDKKGNGYVTKTIVDAVVQEMNENHFDNFNQHVEEVTQVTTLIEDKQETSDNEAMRHSGNSLDYANKINTEYEAIKRNILSRTGENEILVRSPNAPKPSSKKLDTVIDSHLSSFIPPLNRSSNLNSSYYDNLDHSELDFGYNRKIDSSLNDHDQMSTLNEDDSESIMNKSNTSEILNDIIQHVMITEDQTKQLNKIDTDDEFTWQNLVLGHSSNFNSDDEDKLSIKDVIQESEINQHLEEVEQAIHYDENYYHAENYNNQQQTDHSSLNDDNNTKSEEFLIKLDRSQLREFDFSSFDCHSNDNSKFNDIEQQSPILEQELLTTEQEIENLKQKLVMSESVSEMTQSVIDSIRKEYSLSGQSDDENDDDHEQIDESEQIVDDEVDEENKDGDVKIDTSQQIDSVVREVIESLSRDGVSDLEKIVMVEPVENQIVYDSDMEEHENFVKTEHDDEKDCLLRSSSSEMSLLKTKENKYVQSENQDTELDQDSTWYHHTDRNESENLVEKLSLSKQYQTFESSSSSSINDETDQKEKSNKLDQIEEDGHEKAKNDVSIVIHGYASSTADENETKLDRSNLTIDPIKLSESTEQLIDNDHLQRDHSSYNICSIANDDTVIGQSVDDISQATTIVENRFLDAKGQNFCPSSETEDLENTFGIKKTQMYLDIKARDAINLSESTEPLILDQQMNQELTSDSSASVNSLSNSSHYSLTTSDENMAKNLLENENVDLSKSSSSSIDTEDLNRKIMSKSLNFLESLVVPSSLEPSEQMEEYAILLERQNLLDQSDFIQNSQGEPSPMKTSQSLNFETKLNKQMFNKRPVQIDLFSSDFVEQEYNKVCADFPTPTQAENDTTGCFFDKRITSSNEPSIDMLDKAGSTDNSEKNELNVHDSLVDNLISQLSDPEHAEEEVAAAFATAYLFSANVNSQSNEEIKSQVDSVNEFDDDQSENRFCGIDNQAYASSKSSRESVLINYDYDDSLDQQQMKIKVIQSSNPSKSLVSDLIEQSSDSLENKLDQENEIDQSKLMPESDLESRDDEKRLINDSSTEFDENLENEFFKNEKYIYQEKEPLLNDDFVEINDDKIDVHDENDMVIISSSRDLNLDKKMSQMKEYDDDLITKDGVVLDDQSFLICTPVNELNAQLTSPDLDKNEKFSLIAKDLVEETLNKSVEKVLNEIQLNTNNSECSIENLHEHLDLSTNLNSIKLENYLNDDQQQVIEFNLNSNLLNNSIPIEMNYNLNDDKNNEKFDSFSKQKIINFTINQEENIQFKLDSNSSLNNLNDDEKKDFSKEEINNSSVIQQENIESKLESNLSNELNSNEFDNNLIDDENNYNEKKLTNQEENVELKMDSNLSSNLNLTELENDINNDEKNDNVIILDNFNNFSERDINDSLLNQRDGIEIKLDSSDQCLEFDQNFPDESFVGMRTPVVVLEHVASEPNSDDEFDPNQFMENTFSQETTIDFQEEDKNNRILAEKIVDSVLTKSIEKLNEINEESDNNCQSIIKNRSDQSGLMQTNQFGLKEVRFNTHFTNSSPQKSDECLDRDLSTLQQIILNSNSEKTFNQINKINSQKSDSVDSHCELDKIVEDKNEEELSDESLKNNHLAFEAKTICQNIIDNALKKLNDQAINLNDFGPEQHENLSCPTEICETIDKSLDKSSEKYVNTNVVDKNLNESNNLDETELTRKSQLFDNFSENEILEDMQRPLLTSSFMSDTLPSDNDTDQLSYHTAVTGLNESKQNYSSSNYLTAHDDQEQNSQQQLSASDSFYSANSKLKSFDSSILSSFSNINNNSYNNLDESYSTLNDTNNCSDFEHTIVSESNGDSKYEDVQTFIKDMEPLIETNLENKPDEKQLPQISPKQDSASSNSSSAASLDIKGLKTNKMSADTNSSSPLSFNQQLELADNASCSSSILEFEKMEEQCMNNAEEVVSSDLSDAYNYFDQSQILTNDLNTIYEINEKELSPTSSSPLTKSELEFKSKKESDTNKMCKSEDVSANQVDLSIDLTSFGQTNKNQSASATTSPIQSPINQRIKNIGSTSSLTKHVMNLQQLSNSRSSSSSSIKSTDSFENELKTKVKIDESSYFAKVRLKTPPQLENLCENNEQLDTVGSGRKKSSKRASRTSSSTSNSSSASFQGENISSKLSSLNSSLANEASGPGFAVATSKQSKLTAEDLPSFKKSSINPDQTTATKVIGSVSSSNISDSPALQSNQALSQSSNFEQKVEIHRSSSTHSHHSSDCYCGKSSPSLALTTNVSKSNNPTSSSSCFSFTTQSNDSPSNNDEKQLNVNEPSDSTSS